MIAAQFAIEMKLNVIVFQFPPPTSPPSGNAVDKISNSLPLYSDPKIGKRPQSGMQSKSVAPLVSPPKIKLSSAAATFKVNVYSTPRARDPFKHAPMYS